MKYLKKLPDNNYIFENYTKKRALEYRAEFRAKKSNNIQAIFEPISNFTFLILTILFSLYKIEEWSFLYILITLIFLFLGNLVVFLIHKYPLHRNWGPSRFPFKQHTLGHHKYYVDELVTFDELNELDTIFFPWFVNIGFIFLVCPIFYFIGMLLFSSSVGFFFVANACLYFMLYEIVHFTSHLKLSNPVFIIPGLKYMREHHRIHHDPKLMGKYNFCIVYPLWDIILGTKYREK